MKKIRSFKLFAGIALFVDTLTLITVIIVLSIQKKSIPKAIIASLAASGVVSALLLLSYKKDEKRRKKLREMDAFYDYDYEAAYNSDVQDDEDFGLDLDDGVRLVGNDD
ncbi:MAG: hypothetical protein FWH10_01100 [Oscillospiraceae bacterium]|nr:hypothetical protein [Oscillospiraceae bacterium]